MTNEGEGSTAPWLTEAPADGTGFGVFIAGLRRLLNDVTAANPPDEVWAEGARDIADLSARLARYAVPEREQVVGHRSDLPGRGQVMSPMVIVDEADDTHVHARVTFGRHYLGGNGAVHGGAIPLAFDEILGRLANKGGRTRSRTAYLHVNYRSIAPIETELQLAGAFDREEGRKRFLTGTLHHGDTVVADAEGLFVALRPGQP